MAINQVFNNLLLCWSKTKISSLKTILTPTHTNTPITHRQNDFKHFSKTKQNKQKIEELKKTNDIFEIITLDDD